MQQKDDWHLTGEIEHEQGRGDPFAAAVRATRMPMVITDPGKSDNPIIFCNEAFQKLSGYSRDEIVGRNCRFLQGPDTNMDDVARLRQAIASGEAIDVDLLNYRKDGSTFWNALYLSPVRDREGRIQFFFASQMNVTDRVEAQKTIEQQKALIEREVEARTRDLQKALEEKTTLLNEVDHRVKNNLTMIGALIRLQSRQIAQPALTEKLENMLERIDALATVHRRLYQSGDVTRFDIGAFTSTLIADVIGASGRDNITLDAKVDEITVPASSATALGLVLNEVATNSIKHGFRDGRGGTLTVRGHMESDVGMIAIADDGPDGDLANAAAAGMGRTLITRLTRQVGGRAEWTDASPGCRVTISFPLKDE